MGKSKGKVCRVEQKDKTKSKIQINMDGCRWLQTAIATAQTEGLPTPHNLKIVYRFLLSSNLIKKKIQETNCKLLS